jgi:hypothetical protein
LQILLLLAALLTTQTTLATTTTCNWAYSSLTGLNCDPAWALSQCVFAGGNATEDTTSEVVYANCATITLSVQPDGKSASCANCVPNNPTPAMSLTIAVQSSGSTTATFLIPNQDSSAYLTCVYSGQVRFASRCPPCSLLIIVEFGADYVWNLFGVYIPEWPECHCHRCGIGINHIKCRCQLSSFTIKLYDCISNEFCRSISQSKRHAFKHTLQQAVRVWTSKLDRGDI